ncbi:MAG: broad specificity phosphatase PhoE [Cellvibrionaceae bacterium]|jgi:broad specificity phosphatase PhoE
MKLIYVITHPEVVINPDVPVPNWRLSDLGRERMTHILNAPWLNSVTAVYASDEQKAIDGAQIVADQLGLSVTQMAELGEVDRSSTGYMPQKEHDYNGRMLFLHPAESVDGWETAVAAQERMVIAVNQLIEQDSTTGSLVIVTHGAVGSFLMSHLKNRPITLDDAPEVEGGGGLFSFDGDSLSILSEWQNIDIFKL